MNPEPAIQFLPKLLGLGAPALALLGALVVTLTAAQAVAYVVAGLFPTTSVIARGLGTAAVDLGKIATGAKALLGFVLKVMGKAPSGAAVLLLLLGSVGIAVQVPACTPAARAALGIPVVSQIDSVGMAVAHVMQWCQANGVDSSLVDEAQKAIDDRDVYAADQVVRKMLAALAAAGHPVPPEMVAVLQTAEQAAAAQGVEAFAKWSAKP